MSRTIQEINEDIIKLQEKQIADLTALVNELLKNYEQLYSFVFNRKSLGRGI